MQHNASPIEQLAKELHLSNVDLLLLAREVAQDATLRSLRFLTVEQRSALLGILRVMMGFENDFAELLGCRAVAQGLNV